MGPELFITPLLVLIREVVMLCQNVKINETKCKELSSYLEEVARNLAFVKDVVDWQSTDSLEGRIRDKLREIHSGSLAHAKGVVEAMCNMTKSSSIGGRMANSVHAAFHSRDKKQQLHLAQERIKGDVDSLHLLIATRTSKDVKGLPAQLLVLLQEHNRSNATQSNERLSDSAADTGSCCCTLEKGVVNHEQASRNLIDFEEHHEQPEATLLQQQQQAAPSDFFDGLTAPTAASGAAAFSIDSWLDQYPDNHAPVPEPNCPAPAAKENSAEIFGVPHEVGPHGHGLPHGDHHPLPENFPNGTMPHKATVGTTVAFKPQSTASAGGAMPHQHQMRCSASSSGPMASVDGLRQDPPNLSHGASPEKDIYGGGLPPDVLDPVEMSSPTSEGAHLSSATKEGHGSIGSQSSESQDLLATANDRIAPSSWQSSIHDILSGLQISGLSRESDGNQVGSGFRAKRPTKDADPPFLVFSDLQDEKDSKASIWGSELSGGFSGRTGGSDSSVQQLPRNVDLRNLTSSKLNVEATAQKAPMLGSKRSTSFGGIEGGMALTFQQLAKNENPMNKCFSELTMGATASEACVLEPKRSESFGNIEGGIYLNRQQLAKNENPMNNAFGDLVDVRSMKASMSGFK